MAKTATEHILSKDLAEALEVLRDLADIQNGPPLERHRDEYNDIMERVWEILNKYDI